MTHLGQRKVHDIRVFHTKEILAIILIELHQSIMAMLKNMDGNNSNKDHNNIIIIDDDLCQNSFEW